MKKWPINYRMKIEMAPIFYLLEKKGVTALIHDTSITAAYRNPLLDAENETHHHGKGT